MNWKILIYLLEYYLSKYIESTALTPDTRYDKIGEVDTVCIWILTMIQACGGRGYFVTTPAELRKATKDALEETVPVIVNVMIEPSGKKKLV